MTLVMEGSGVGIFARAHVVKVRPLSRHFDAVMVSYVTVFWPGPGTSVCIYNEVVSSSRMAPMSLTLSVGEQLLLLCKKTDVMQV